MFLLKPILLIPLVACSTGGDQTYGGNGQNKPCVFPFVYKGQTIGECIDDNHDRPWCATTANFDADRLWGNCLYPRGQNHWNPLNFTYDGNGGKKPCVFPFTYNGLPWTDCIMTNHDRPWCGVTADYDNDRLWGNCVYPKTSNVVTKGGNSNGATCFFPFLYSGKLHYECTEENHHTPWCATTPTYDLHFLWGNCPAIIPTPPGPAGLEA